MNPDAQIRLHEIGAGRSCAVVDDALEDPESLVDFAVEHASRFAWMAIPPGPRLAISDHQLEDLRRYVRSKLSRHFPIHRAGIELNASLSNVTVAPEKLSHLQRMCHIDRRASQGRRTYAGVIYLFRDPDLGGTGFYRWTRPEVIAEAERLFLHDPAASLKYLEEASEIFNEPPRYMTESNDLAELLTVVPAKFNRLIFYNGEAPHSGHIAHPELLSDDLSKGRLTLNFFVSVHPRETTT
ncbi:MAG: DUF6445 family protein [Xanthomonadales bacterium]|nr:DUF6445 family protein [Xanthomonadales bacterium]